LRANFRSLSPEEDLEFQTLDDKFQAELEKAEAKLEKTTEELQGTAKELEKSEAKLEKTTGENKVLKENAEVQMLATVKSKLRTSTFSRIVDIQRHAVEDCGVEGIDCSKVFTHDDYSKGEVR
jgi:hypothetical protein